jgi:hypothetical protein
MTAVIRRWTRCRKPNDLSDRLAAVWGYRSKNLGAVQIDLLVQDQFREVVALALFLGRSRKHKRFIDHFTQTCPLSQLFV